MPSLRQQSLRSASKNLADAHFSVFTNMLMAFADDAGLSRITSPLERKIKTQNNVKELGEIDSYFDFFFLIIKTNDITISE